MMLIVDTSEDGKKISNSEKNDNDISDKQRHNHNGGSKCTVEMRSQVRMIMYVHKWGEAVRNMKTMACFQHLKLLS